MMLQALYDLGIREGLVPEPGFAPIPISYIIVVGEGGKLDSIVSTLDPSPTGKGKPLPRKYRLPRDNGRTVNVEAQFLWDKPDYVFGINPDAKKDRLAEWLEKRRRAFHDLIAEAAADTGDSALADCAKLLDRIAAEVPSLDALLTLTSAKAIEPNGNFTFRHASDAEALIAERPAVRGWWRRRVAPPADGVRTQCLVTGTLAIREDKHPTIKNVPGGNTKGVPFVSFNNPSFESYGLAGNENAPISHDAAEAIGAALNRLLDRRYPDPTTGSPMPVRRVDIADDTALLFWTREGDEGADLFAATLDADPGRVRALYEAPQLGRRPILEETTPFYALALSGEMARAKVRGWFELELGQALKNVKLHFDDIAIIRPSFDADAPMPLKGLLLSLCPTSQKHPRGDWEKLPPNLSAGVMTAILTGSLYPRALLESAVRRARSERDVTPARAACLKAYFSRAHRVGRLRPAFPEVKIEMDTESQNAPYRLGRLFATLERLQESALPGTNATIRDRYFGAASATPTTVFPRLIRGAQAHVSKLEGRGTFFEKLIQEIVQPVQTFPAHLNLEEQGLFALGYYHQRQSFFTKKSDSADKET